MIIMDDIYIVLANSEIDSAYKSSEAANNRIVELCRFSFEDVLYDELCLAYSETTSIKVCQLI
jgi:Fe-S-cluster containining protein